MGYSFRSAARVLLYATSHWQNNIYHGLCYTSRETLAGMRNSLMGPSWRIDPTTHHTMCKRCYHGATSRFLICSVCVFNLCRLLVQLEVARLSFVLCSVCWQLFPDVLVGWREQSFTLTPREHSVQKGLIV